MKLSITYKKIAKDTKEENLKHFEMDIDDAQMNLPDSFWLLNLEKSKTSLTLEVWQGDQYIIAIILSTEKDETLQLKFYDFDIFLSFAICER